VQTAKVVRLSLLAVIGGAALFAVASVTGIWSARGADRPVPVAQESSAEELHRDLFSAGWRVKHPPDLPGPYRKRLPGVLHYHPDGGHSTVRLRDRSGTVFWEEQTRPGVAFHTMVLETLDGQVTQGLLVYGE
jgi:hypothetical protein